MHLYKTALSNCNYDSILTDWTAFLHSINIHQPTKAGDTAASRMSTFEAWAQTMRMAIDSVLLHSLYQICHTRLALAYERFVDWAVTLGVVPVAAIKPDIRTLHNMQNSLDRAYSMQGRYNSTLTSVYVGVRSELTAVMEQLLSIYVPDYAEATITYNAGLGTFSSTYRNVSGRAVVLNRPIIGESSITFDSPVQRLLQSVMSCHRTAEHAKVCQLLNTQPVKAVLSGTTNNLYKDILDQLEKSAQKTDPRREMLKLLVKLAENKTISGVTDIVEEFVSDVSQQVVDRNKLFGTTTSSSAAQGLKKQVSNTVFKCLTNQINEQFDVIASLQAERESLIKQVHNINAQLGECHAQEPSRNTAYGDIRTNDTLKTLEALQQSSIGATFAHVPSGHSVVNSFLSQYVPPVQDMMHDLSDLWEQEIFQAYRLVPVVDNQGQRIYVRYSEDTVSILLAPFTYMVADLPAMELIPDIHCSASFREIADYLYKTSRLALYIKDIGQKYCAAAPLEIPELSTANYGNVNFYSSPPGDSGPTWTQFGVAPSTLGYR